MQFCLERTRLGGITSNGLTIANKSIFAIKTNVRIKTVVLVEGLYAISCGYPLLLLSQFVLK